MLAARMTPHKKLYIKTYGCQMNVYDSGRMADVLAPLGYGATDSPDDADLVILNTCHIREKAAEKVYSEIGRLRPLKRRKQEAGGRMILAVAGCVAQAEGEEMARRAPAVDIVLGPQAYHRLPELVARAHRACGAVLDTDFPVEPKFDSLPEPTGDGAVGAFVTVQEGCDKFCTFCVVPYTRGAEYASPAAQFIAEVERRVALGVREVTLLGQNVNAYRGEGPDGPWSLARLIAALDAIPGLARIRYTTSHPRDVTDEQIAAHRDVAKLMPYLHLPVQAGSDRVLQAMNRRSSTSDYRRIVERLRRARPDIALSGDFIVGFPGESDLDVEATLALVRDVGYAQAFSFMYSARPGTPAANLPGQVPEAAKRERLARLQALIEEQTRAFNRAAVGRRLPVLLERDGRHPGQRTGRTPYLQTVHLHAPAAATGDVVDVDIVALHPNSLAGRLAGAPEEAA